MAGEREASRPFLLSRECNNRCIFCGQAGLPPAGDRDLEAELREARDASDRLTLVGGEPTLDAALPDVVSLAKTRGFRSIVLQTNGAKLDEALAAELARRGLTGVHLSIHGAEARVHDYHTGNPGSFVRLLAALDAARSAKLFVSVTTVVTRSNFRVLSPIPALVSERGASAWMLAFPAAAGRASVAVDRIVPRYGLAVPYALHAIDAAARLRLPAVISGVPSCLLGPFASSALPEAPRVFADACGNCEARETCAGVDAYYLGRFGGDELSPGARIARDPSVLQLAQFFVGPGELARPDAVTVESQPRRALPMLGKVKPAIAEAPPNTVRRTGEALRDILPALFAGDPSAPNKRAPGAGGLDPGDPDPK
jgi:hypothetical protein